MDLERRLVASGPRSRVHQVRTPRHVYRGGRAVRRRRRRRGPRPTWLGSLMGFFMGMYAMKILAEKGLTIEHVFPEPETKKADMLDRRSKDWRRGLKK